MQITTIDYSHRINCEFVEVYCNPAFCVVNELPCNLILLRNTDWFFNFCGHNVLVLMMPLPSKFCAMATSRF